jgi:predicted DNA-binding transcriptional regulator AlpA
VKSETTTRYLRVSEIAPMLGISISTWWAWAAAKKTPPAIKLSPGVTVWDYAEVMAFIAARRGNAAQDGAAAHNAEQVAA